MSDPRATDTGEDALDLEQLDAMPEPAAGLTEADFKGCRWIAGGANPNPPLDVLLPPCERTGREPLR